MGAELGLSARTVGRAAKQLGLKPYHRRKRPSISSENTRKRFRFAKEHKEEDWSAVLFEDEKTFEVGHHPNRKNDVVYAYSADEVPTIPKVAHPAKLNVAAAVSEKGRTELHIFKENMMGELYKQILSDTILPGAQKILGSKPWTLLQDSDPKHTSAVVRSFLDQHGTSYFSKDDWPAQSPDINIMEDVWAMLLDAINKQPPHTIRQLEAALKREWKKLPQHKLSNAVNSMPARLAAVRAAKGGSTKY